MRYSNFILEGLAVAVFCFCSNSQAGPTQCNAVFENDVNSKVDAIVLSPLDNTMAQLEARLVKVEQLLPMTGPQTQRQSKKMMNRITEIVADFARTGDISNKAIDTLVKLGQQLDTLENKLMDVERAQQIDPFDLNRYLHTAEPIRTDVEYHADLPAMGQTVIKFSKEVADALSSSGFFRDILFPMIFKGMVGKKGANGLKSISSGESNSKTVGGVEYHLVELKKIAHRARIIAVYSSEGSLFFYKVITNHQRIERIAAEALLDHYLKNY